jgi:hypothetical protein
VSASVFYSNPIISLVVYVTSASLDAVDGFIARKLGQTSAVGAWLDVAVDNFGRSMLWCRTTHVGFVVSSLEWLTFVCNHTHGQKWKSRIVGPWFVQRVMQNNFRTALGVFAVGSLNVLPVWLYIVQSGVLSQLLVPLPLSVQQLISLFLITGRVLCAAVEVWCIGLHAAFLCCSKN